jgi:hypothetical protein
MEERIEPGDHGRSYLVQWVGFPPSWEPEAGVQDSEVYREWLASKAKRNRKPRGQA